VTHRALIFRHEANAEAGKMAAQSAARLEAHGWEPVMEGQDDAGPFDVAIVYGGDGTLLRAAEATRGRGIPVLGINAGHLGFLAEAEGIDLDGAIDRLASGNYRVEDRATVRARITGPDGEQSADWALNEVSVAKTIPQRMIEVSLRVDSRPISQFGCDGIVLATPTGSTGHAFSGGGPVVWPEVEALLVVPLCAHALFARPLVVSPSAVVTVELLADSRSPAEAGFDGRRFAPVRPGDVVEVRHSAEPVKLVRFGSAPFADRLVKKFALPVEGWRSGNGRVPPC